MIELRPYQGESIDSLRDGFRNGHRRQVLAASTGAGKSVIALALINAALSKGSRTMFVCDRRVLVDQFSAHLDRHGIEHGVFMAKHWRYRPEALVQVASIQTLEKMRSWPVTDLVIVDEIHAVMRKSLKEMFSNWSAMRVIGLTATPFHPELGKHFSSITNVITMDQLVKDKHLVPFRVFAATEINTQGVKVTAGEWQKDELETRGLQIVGDVVADYVRISNQVWGEQRKTICFSSGVAHGQELVNRFASVGLNFVQISYKDDEEYKQEVIKEFAKPDTSIHGLISSDILTRGFDVTDVEHIILARPLRKSFSTHVQMCGRGARTHAGKNFCVIQDNSGNWLRFLDSWDDLYHNGTKSLRSDEDIKQRKEPTKYEKEKAKCPKCGHFWSGSTCQVCGHTRQRASEVVEVPGEIAELGNAANRKHDIAYKSTFYAGLLGYCKAKGYKTGWAYHQYKEKFGVYPANTFAKDPLPPNVEVLNFVRYQAIRRGSRSQAMR
jgi:superfamily II DNA or RNA helicase